MSASGHCDRCGAVLTGEGTPGAPRLCPPCRAAQPLPVPRRPVLPLLTVVAVVGVAAWAGLRLNAVEGRLKGLERRLQDLPESPTALAEAETQVLKDLAKHPPAAREDLVALKAEVAKLQAAEVRPAGMGVLRPLPPGPEASTPPPPPPPPTPIPEVPPPAPSALDLAKDLASEDPLVRHQALALIQRVDQAPAAVRLLQDEMGFVRRSAAEALGRLKVPETVPALCAMARGEKDLLAKRAALQALESLTAVHCLTPEGSENDALARCEAWWKKKGAP